MTARDETRTVLVAHPSADLYGSDRVMLETVSGLVAVGRRVVVTVPRDGPLVPLLRDRGAEVRFCPAAVVRKSALSPRGLAGLLVTGVRNVVAGVRLAREVRARSVLVNTLTIPGWLLVGRLARAAVLCHVHEAEGSASPVLRRLLALPLLLAHTIVVNSRFSLGVLVEALPRLRGRSAVLLNAVPGPDRSVQTRPQPQDPLRLVYVGRLSPRKGVDVAVDAAIELRRRGRTVRLDLVGAVFPGYEWYESQLRTQVRDAGVEETVAFCGFQPDMWPALARADVALVPSRGDEPFGNTAVEAVLAGRPVVTSATSGLLEAGEGYGGVRAVPPQDPSALADAVESLVASWSDLDLEEDRRRALERHSPARYQEHVVAIVEDLEART